MIQATPNAPMPMQGRRFCGLTKSLLLGNAWMGSIVAQAEPDG
jgi:hypothetical protein